MNEALRIYELGRSYWREHPAVALACINRIHVIEMEQKRATLDETTARSADNDL